MSEIESKIIHRDTVYNKDQEYCSGLPFVGNRKLNELEIIDLKTECKFIILKTVFILTSIPFIIFILFVVISILNKVKFPISYLDNILAVIAILVLLLGIPVVILLTRDLINRFRIYKNTITKGYVRQFGGSINFNDFSNYTLKYLRKLNFIDKANEFSKIELFNENDILYSVNGTRTKKWLPIRITRAALKNPDTPQYALPKEWFTYNESTSYERRRLNDGEKDELLFYIKKIKKRYWYLILIGYCSLGVLNPITFNLFRLTSTIGALISIGGAFIISVIFFLKIKRTSNLFRKDVNAGWVIIYMTNSEQNDRKQQIEFLMFSKSIWSIDGIPAGWRQKNKERKK